jgi:hypothetical protein
VLAIAAVILVLLTRVMPLNDIAVCTYRSNCRKGTNCLYSGVVVRY